ncbi:30S ribosome-binding factor RbfA [Blastochloris sulfoviridis]|uniref:Ribosome-binding factor A n=1 Tax=Blastochloris sulfoviridis TaxID=50712 RepID=A0A5M6I194_9HYPH|nr:30S ribosome-binding factor RbfA [Blastochloris sulfoviridis]KAA5601951.1 30S ribosome-binding factor RbfA [Blastochloris sulfoviridis]
MSRNRPDSAQAGPSQRQLRVAELVRHAIADILARGEIADPVISGHLITVPEVRMSPDMRLATIYVVALGGKDETAVLKALEAHHKFIRTEIAHRVNLRYAPDIRFRRDDRFEEAERIDRLLRSPEVARDLDPSETTDDSDEETRS